MFRQENVRSVREHAEDDWDIDLIHSSLSCFQWHPLQNAV